VSGWRSAAYFKAVAVSAATSGAGGPEENGALAWPWLAGVVRRTPYGCLSELTIEEL